MNIEEIYDDGRLSLDEMIASGEYESNCETVMKGFKVFQKRYVYKGVIFQMLLVILGIASQVLNIATASPDEDVSFSYLLIMLCVILAAYIIIRPKNTYRRLERSMKELDGIVYKSEIFTKKIVITTIHDPYEEKKNDDEQNEEKEDGPPATVIHLDNFGVEIVETPDLYVLYIKKINVFVIPKSAFKPYEIQSINDKLSDFMGVRFKKN